MLLHTTRDLTSQDAALGHNALICKCVVNYQLDVSSFGFAFNLNGPQALSGIRSEAWCNVVIQDCTRGGILDFHVGVMC